MAADERRAARRTAGAAALPLLLPAGGTAAALRELGVEVRDVQELTGFPEMLGGRVKTLHPAVHAGLLAVRGNAEHEAQLTRRGIPFIDLVVSNLCVTGATLRSPPDRPSPTTSRAPVSPRHFRPRGRYPFDEAVRSGADFETCVENIDIGGPTMIRAAAKNHAGVAVLSSPAQYGAFVDELDDQGGTVGADLRRRLAAEAFAATAAYDTAVGAWFAEQTASGTAKDADAADPPTPTSYERSYTPEFSLKCVAMPRCRAFLSGD